MEKSSIHRCAMDCLQMQKGTHTKRMKYREWEEIVNSVHGKGIMLTSTAIATVTTINFDDTSIDRPFAMNLLLLFANA